jgi:hypothetical protein
VRAASAISRAIAETAADAAAALAEFAARADLDLLRKR